MTARVVIGVQTSDGYDLYHHTWDETTPTPDRRLRKGWRPRSDTRLASGLSRADLFDRIDWLLDAYLYVVSNVGVQTRVLVPLRIESGAPGAATAAGPGAAAVPTDTTAQRLRARLSGVREVCGLLVDAYGLDRSNAEAALRRIVDDRSDDVIIR